MSYGPTVISQVVRRAFPNCKAAVLISLSGCMDSQHSTSSSKTLGCFSSKMSQHSVFWQHQGGTVGVITVVRLQTAAKILALIGSNTTVAKAAISMQQLAYSNSERKNLVGNKLFYQKETLFTISLNKRWLQNSFLLFCLVFKLH